MVYFEVKKTKVQDDTLYAIEIYRQTNKDTPMPHCYIDTIHAMSLKELQTFKNYLSELIWKEIE